MNNKVVLVTPPDDVLYDGVRIALVGLSTPQADMLTKALNLFDSIPMTVIYVWNSNEVPWLIDKKHKCDLIIFNAEYQDPTLVGYLSAHTNSYYLGTLKTLGIINNRVIHDIDQLFQILEEAIKNYELRIK